MKLPNDTSQSLSVLLTFLFAVTKCLTEHFKGKKDYFGLGFRGVQSLTAGWVWKQGVWQRKETKRTRFRVSYNQDQVFLLFCVLHLSTLTFQMFHKLAKQAQQLEIKYSQTQAHETFYVRTVTVHHWGTHHFSASRRCLASTLCTAFSFLQTVYIFAQSNKEQFKVRCA